VTVGALPASRKDRELIAPPSVIGGQRLLLRALAGLLLGLLFSICAVAMNKSIDGARPASL